ncbi:MAG: serine hydrolase [Planctomycetales bacterium]|nr:serine hydrolase [Planctomycetales bacterium]
MLSHYCKLSRSALILLAIASLAPAMHLPTIRAEELRALPDSSVSEIEARIRRWQRQTQTPGVSVAIASNHQLQYAAGFGVADLEHGTPVNTETLFRTASVAKPMTAVLILRLMEQQQLGLDRPVQDYCAAFPTKQWPVNCRDLLGHLAGVRHYNNQAEADSTRHFNSLSDALSVFAKDPLKHKPGTQFLYSTFGYNLLGSVAEGAGQDNFMSLLRQYVLQPSDMQQTVTDDHFAIRKGRSRGYARQNESILNAPLHDTSMKIPGGGLLSTPSDLVRFALAVNQDKLLTSATKQLMWTPGETTDGKSTGYGLGWGIGKSREYSTVSHSGSQAGVSTFLLLLPDAGVCVSIMCNLQLQKLGPLAHDLAFLVVPAKPKPDYTTVKQKLKQAIQHEVAAKDLPAFSISLVDGGQTIWSEGFGFEDADRKRPATADTIYRVGSVSKLLTDIAVMQLVERGELKLDEPVSNILPDFSPADPRAKQITLRQLMSHRSGLVRESPVGNYFDPNEPSLEQTVASLNQTSLTYAPGTKIKYSNAAIAAVGAALQRHWQQPFETGVQQSVLEPLKMASSRFDLRGEKDEPLRKRLATAWMWTYDDRRFVAPTFLLGTGPAGNLYSTVNDLGRFLQCLFDDGRLPDGGRLLTPESLDEMTTPVLDENGQPLSFGLGFRIDRFAGHRRIGHGGAVYGFSTQLEALPAEQLGVAAVAALDGSNGVVQRLSEYALQLMLAARAGETLPEYATTTAPPAERLWRLAGEYLSEDGSHVRLIPYNDRLLMERGSLRAEIRADAKGQFVVDDTFQFGERLTLTNDGDLMLGETLHRRQPDEPPAPAPDRWRGLIGEYGWDHNTLYILEDRGKLTALIEWFYRYPLEEVSENVFAFPDYGLYHGEQLEFKRDANGIATEVVAAEVRFARREVGTKDGETFKIKPVRPIDELRGEAMKASPPVERGEFRDAELVELTSLDRSTGPHKGRARWRPEHAIQLDIRYATNNNFTGAVFYQQPRAYMQRPAAEAVVAAHRSLQPLGLGLLIHDAYRPWHVTKMFWDATPGDLKDFVANPANGSRHNRGCAVDLTLYDLNTGQPIPMVATYDEFSPRSFPLYPGGESRQRWHRQVLRHTMEEAGFRIYEFEWWHFDYRDWKQYRIGNATFEELGGIESKK